MASLLSRTSSYLWVSFGAYARSQILSILQQGILLGQLELTDASGTYLFGASDFEKKGKGASLVVLKDDFWIRIFLSHDLGFAEAYMYGDFRTPDLKSILKLWLDNRDSLAALSTSFNQLRYMASALFSRFLGQTLAISVSNVVTGYDCSNTLFQAFLSKEMMYSCALWSESEGGLRGDLINGSSPGQLEAAQEKKIQHLLRKARVQKGFRLLEFGTGWGGMAIAAGCAGCTVDSVTLSVEQKKLAEERIAAAGLEGSVRVHLLDYRNLPPDFHHAFDSFVSCEMFEAVGLQHHSTFFNILDWALKPDRAAAVITATTQPEFRYSKYQAADYARRYQWPNTFLPSATSFADAAVRFTKGRFVLESIEDHGPHYPRTLREWGYRLDASWTPELINTLCKENPELQHGDNINILKRKWEYMYMYAEVGYARAYTSMNCWTLARPEYVAYPCD